MGEKRVFFGKNVRSVGGSLLAPVPTCGVHALPLIMMIARSFSSKKIVVCSHYVGTRRNAGASWRIPKASDFEHMLAFNPSEERMAA